jgi:hypothetical protein
MSMIELTITWNTFAASRGTIVSPERPLPRKDLTQFNLDETCSLGTNILHYAVIWGRGYRPYTIRGRTSKPNCMISEPSFDIMNMRCGINFITNLRSISSKSTEHFLTFNESA